jgi:hypothetical protein
MLFLEQIMKLDLSVSVLDEKDAEIIDPETSKAMPLFHWVRMAIISPLESDPKNLEHTRKLQTIFAKLERAKESKIVEFKTETISFIRERMIQCKMHLLIMSAFEVVAEGQITDAALDAV